MLGSGRLFAAGLAVVTVLMGAGSPAGAEGMRYQSTWMKGSRFADQWGEYGTIQVPHPDNAPGARWGAAAWVDSSGGFWLFGGLGYNSIGTLGSLYDLWRYDPATGNWTWEFGSPAVNLMGFYGTQGVPSGSNTPGSRRLASSWTDIDGKLWLFGGSGYDSAADVGQLNDLWRFDPDGRTWTWMKGSNVEGSAGVYGTQGVPSETNTPGARDRASSWTDSSGMFWLFGGYGYDSVGDQDVLNDLWQYDPGTGNWTWMMGSSLAGSDGVYGTQGVPSGANTPGSRAEAVPWLDNEGSLWLFGGDGYDSVGGVGFLNDLWHYDPGTGNWTWKSGSSVASQPGQYGRLGQEEESNTPGAREGGVAWTDDRGRLWLFGGFGISSGGTTLGYFDNLWCYKPETENWIWVKGASTINARGTYGTQEVGNSGLLPGSRYHSSSWRDSEGAFWLFGGDGYDTTGSLGYLNDVWRILEFSHVTFVTDGTPGAALSGETEQWIVRIDDGTPVQAVAPEGTEFFRWTRGGMDYSADNPLTVQGVSEDMVLTAEFLEKEIGLTYIAGPNGSISGMAVQSAFYGGDGTPVEAVPDEGYHFVLWSDGSIENPRTDTNVTSSLKVTAYFGIQEYDLIYSAGPGGSVSGPVHQTVAHGSDGSLVEAFGDDGQSFVEWSDGSTENRRTDTNVTSDLIVTAFFDLDQYTLFYGADDNGSISGETTQNVGHGYNGTEVRAVPSSGYVFVEWSDGVRANPRRDVNVTEGLDVIAVFGSVTDGQRWIVR